MEIGQARSMLQQRMQSLVVQDKAQVQSLWQKFDSSGNGYLEMPGFLEALDYFGVQLEDNVAAKFMRKFVKNPNRITYEEFFVNLLGLPSDFSSSKSKSKKKSNNQCSKPLSNRFLNSLPTGTPIEAVDKLFRAKLRKQLFNLDRCMFTVLKRPSASANSLDRDCLFNMFVGLGLTPTKMQIDDIMNYFDPAGTGKLSYDDLARSVLKLPRRRGPGGTVSRRNTTEPLGRAKSLLDCLRMNAERAAAQPKELIKFFRQFDADGSGMITYNELASMVQDYGCNVQGMDTPGELLKRYAGDLGAMTYVAFLTRVLGLRKDSLRDPGMPDMPSTPELQQQVSSNFNRVSFGNQEAVNRAFADFDRDGSGELSMKEFVEGVEALQLPISKNAATNLFKEYDVDKSGLVRIEDLSRQLLQQPPACTQRGESKGHNDMMLCTVSSLDNIIPRTGRSNVSGTSSASSRYTFCSEDARQAATMTSKELRKHLTKMHLDQAVAGGGSTAASITRRSMSSAASGHSNGSNSLSIDEALCSARSALDSAAARTPQPRQSARVFSMSARSGACTPQPCGSARSVPTPARSNSAMGGSLYHGSTQSLCSAPKTQSQLRAEGRLSSRRNTFEMPPSSSRSRLVPIGVTQASNWTEARYMSTPGNGMRLPRSDVPVCDVPKPVQTKHNIDGHNTYDLKSVGAFGGAGKKGNRNWIGGADRTCNALMAQPNMPF